ncbi:MAG TPA: type II secretion system F family protein [Streptosporangiaceae bacterium]
MTLAVVAGAVMGIGLFLLTLALIPRRVSLARQIAAFDAGPAGRSARVSSRPSDEKESEFSRRMGIAIAKFCTEQGWDFPSIRANLSLTGKTFESYLAQKVLLAVFGLVFVPILTILAGMAGISFPVVIPVWISLIVAAFFFFLPDLELKQKATARRRDFRHAVGSFLDLVAMNLSGGRGVPEALMAASEIGSGWAMWRIRDALTNARITGQTPWQALGLLGEEVGVEELTDLSAALGLVAEDGAKVRQSLTARAASLRRREISDLEGKAGERSQSMLIAQMLLCIGFLLFILYPAAIAIFAA